MASRAHETGMASTLPLNLIAQAIHMLSRHELEAVTERLIERLDHLDPEPDMEDDDQDTCAVADDQGSKGGGRFGGDGLPGDAEDAEESYDREEVYF